jgi:23S rRNA (guanosine2251-2'-O)-methyltransferase
MRKLKSSEISRLSIEQFKSASKIPVVIILDNIRSQNNIGSVFRSGDAFRIEALYLCGITATPPHREIHKSALGSTESVHWKYFPSALDAIHEVKKMGYKIYAVEQTDKTVMLDAFIPEFSTGMGIIFGNEVTGIDEKVIAKADECIEIPQFGTKHSLNISVAAGIVIWDIVMKYRNYFEKMQPI